MNRRTALWAVVAIAAVGIAFAGYLVFGPGPTDFVPGANVPLADYHAGDPTGVPPQLRSASVLARGEYLTRAADCVVCHTAANGTPFAGGRAFVLPFGTLYSTNITPDGPTGIGAYSDRQFLDALRRGIRRDGKALYPAMPFASYTYLSDADALAIKAYLFSLRPVRAPARQNALVFPFDQRPLMRMWALLFNRNRRFEPNDTQGPAWNRGAYLAEALGHCGECHTPRNLAFALNERRKFAGTIQAGWDAYNISADPTSGIGAWSEADLNAYLSSGHAPGHGTAAGPMGEVVDESLSHLAADDVRALVTYLRSVPTISSRSLPAVRDQPASDRYSEGPRTAPAGQGEALFAGACFGCHGWSGISPGMALAALIGSRAVNDPRGTNVVQAILSGGHRAADTGIAMPPFGATYSDEEVAALTNYVTARFGAAPSQLSARAVGQLRAQE